MVVFQRHDAQLIVHQSPNAQDRVLGQQVVLIGHMFHVRGHLHRWVQAFAASASAVALCPVAC